MTRRFLLLLAAAIALGAVPAQAALTVAPASGWGCAGFEPVAGLCLANPIDLLPALP